MPGKRPLPARSLRRNHRRSEEHTSELQSRQYLVCRLLLEKKKKKKRDAHTSSMIRTIYSMVLAVARDRGVVSCGAGYYPSTYPSLSLCFFFFFSNDTATTEIYTLSLHDALPISYIGFFRACQHERCPLSWDDGSS